MMTYSAHDIMYIIVKVRNSISYSIFIFDVAICFVFEIACVEAFD